MRIVQVLNTFELGGAERMALNFALALLDAGHEPIFYCIAGEGDLAAEARQHGITVKNFGKAPGVSLLTVVSMARSLVHDRPNAVHSHNPPAHYYAAVAARLARVPVLVNTRHSPISSRGSAYREKYFEWLLPFTDQVVFVSEQARTAVERAWGNTRAGQKVCVIPNGIPSARFRATPAHPGSRYPRITFGTIGRLAAVKGHDVLLKAFRRVADTIPEAQLRIVGSGIQGETLQQQCSQLGLSNRVSIEPATSDVSRVLSEFDVFVISSLSEGMPLVVLEAMAAGLPIVSTRVGGIPEVVPEGQVGWFCAPGDVDALAGILLQAYSSSELAVRGREAARIASERYDSSTMAARYVDLFIRLQGGGH
jgi:glycosyltransferase involved in cell wall biosynthesis